MLISCPHIEKRDDGWCYITAQIMRGEKTEEVWYAVEEKYGKFLVDDRLDAFVIPFLPYAMEQGEDIVCEAPITNRLLYQLNHYLIPILAKHIEEFKPIKIVAKGTNVTLPCAKAVGTGWTGGVDSMFTAMKHLQIDNPSYKLTHLVIANCGTFESDDNSGLLHYMLNKARNGFAKETALQVVGIDSNLQDVLQENYLSVAAYRLPATILVLQKLFSSFLHSGAYEFYKLKFLKENSAYYEFFPLWLYETDTTHFYSTGSEVSRIEKIRELSNFPLAQQYLHPCVYQRRYDNCGKCGKCIRTMGALYALDELDKFTQVFDVSAFYANLDNYLANILLYPHSQHYKEVIIELLQKKGVYNKIITEKVKQKTAMLLRHQYSQYRERLKEK